MYESFYGFSEKPFSLTPDPKYLFLSRRHLEAFAHLEYARRERGGFVVITGEVGAGKTTLARYFLGRLDAGTATAFVLYPAVTGVELLRKVGRRVQLTPQAEILVAAAGEVLALLERAEAALAASGESVTGRVRVAVFQSAALALMPGALRSIAETEGLAVENEDIDRHVELFAQQFDRDAEEIRGQLTDGDGMAAVRSDLLKQKALDWLTEQVDIVDDEGQPIDRADLEPPPGEEESDE